MSSGSQRDWREVLLSYPCDTCGAGPGDRCRTWSGVGKAEPHAPRSHRAHDRGWAYAEDDLGPEDVPGAAP